MKEMLPAKRWDNFPDATDFSIYTSAIRDISEEVKRVGAGYLPISVAKGFRMCPFY